MSKNMRAQDWFIFFAITITFAVYGGRMLVIGITQAWTGYDSNRWKPAIATVASLSFERVGGVGGRSSGASQIVANIQYAFTVNDIEFTGDKFQPTLKKVVQPEHIGSFEHQYAPGSPIEIRYDNNDPSRSAVFPGKIRDGAIPLLIGTGLTSIALVAVIAASLGKVSRPN